jgi:hypothetical protein
MAGVFNKKAVFWRRIMKTNIGVTDRAIRFLLGTALLLLGIFVLGDVWRWVAIVLGAIGVVTAFTGFCLLYLPFGINTSTVKKSSSEVAD